MQRPSPSEVTTCEPSRWPSTTSTAIVTTTAATGLAAFAIESDPVSSEEEVVEQPTAGPTGEELLEEDTRDETVEVRGDELGTAATCNGEGGRGGGKGKGGR